jgi:hypothetical protein
VWLRPANPARGWPPALSAACDRFDARPDQDPAGLAGRLWDLEGWARRGAALLAGLDREVVPARRFALAAAVARHLRTDPVLARRLLPPGWWPGCFLPGGGPAARRRTRRPGHEAAVPDDGAAAHCARPVGAPAGTDTRRPRRRPGWSGDPQPDG